MDRVNEADAYEFVARWHDRQAVLFEAMSRDEPRTSQVDRLKAALAATHHAGSAAALRLAAMNIRRAALVAKGETDER